MKKEKEKKKKGMQDDVVINCRDVVEGPRENVSTFDMQTFLAALTVIIMKTSNIENRCLVDCFDVWFELGWKGCDLIFGEQSTEDHLTKQVLLKQR